MNTKNLSKNSKKLIILASILLLIFITSLIFYLVEIKSRRMIFVFQSLDDNKTHFEIRYLPKVSKEQRVKQYIDDLLLGPINDRYRPLFAIGTVTGSVVPDAFGFSVRTGAPTTLDVARLFTFCADLFNSTPQFSKANDVFISDFCWSVKDAPAEVP